MMMPAGRVVIADFLIDIEVMSFVGVCSLKIWKKCSTYRAGAYCSCVIALIQELSLSAQSLNRTNEFAYDRVFGSCKAAQGSKVIGSSD